MLLSCFEIAVAGVGLESMVMNSLNAAKEAAKNDASGDHVPGFSMQGAEALGSQMSKMTDSELKHKAHQKMQEAAGSNGAISRLNYYEGFCRTAESSP